MRNKQKDNNKKLYIPLSDIEEIDNDFLNEIERVHARLSAMSDDKEVIKSFYDVLTSTYNAAIEIKALECEVDYDIKRAKIEERRRNLKPWRRCWLWRLLFQPLTNRAQDIIEERAEVDADIIHTAAEEATDKEREKLSSDSDNKLSKRELKRKMRDELKAVIKKADNADLNEVLSESPINQGEPQQGAETPGRTKAKQTEPCELDKPAQTAELKPAGQLPGQITLDEVQKQPPVPERRPRPPRSCRKPSTSGQ